MVTCSGRWKWSHLIHRRPGLVNLSSSYLPSTTGRLRLEAERHADPFVSHGAQVNAEHLFQICSLAFELDGDRDKRPICSDVGLGHDDPSRPIEVRQLIEVGCLVAAFIPEVFSDEYELILA